MITFDIITDLEERMQARLVAWREAKQRYAEVQEELLGIELDTRIQIMAAVMADKKEGMFGALQPGDRCIRDFAMLELRKNERWKELRAESKRLLIEIDLEFAEYELLSQKWRMLLMSSGQGAEPRAMRAH